MAPGETDDPLKRLGERLESASEAAERLIGEAAARVGDRVKPPPSGWQNAEEGPAPAGAGADVALLLQALREFVPDDLQRRLSEAIHELLLAVRALIDWYLERIEQRRAKPVEVQDIPVL